MIRLIRTELVKLRTIRLPYALLGTTAGVTALITSLRASRAGHTGFRGSEIAPLNTVAGLTRVMTFTDFGLLLAMVFGVIVASGEFRHGTATSTYLATPDRNRVLIAKGVAAAGIGLLFGAVASGVATGVALAFVAAKGYSVALAWATIARFAGGAVVAAALLAAIGVGVGSLIRQQVGAIVGVFAWGFVIEQVVGALFPSAARYLPYTAATTMAGGTIGGGVNPLPWVAAAALVAGVAALVSAVAARITVPRDIA